MSSVNKAKKGFFGALLFYFFVAFEFAYMAGPFAIYFYSVYSPILNFLNEIPIISKLVKFFLPHVVRNTSSPFIKGIEILGIILSVVGFLIFIVGACQIYYSKLAKKGPVLGGLYTYIRHPQYTSFIVCSFGLLLLWPRYIVIFFYVTLTFGYYLLARAEEKECEEKFGDSYIEYEKRTGRFFPMIHIRKSTSQYAQKISKKRIVICYLLTLILFYTTAFGLNILTIHSLYADYEEGKATIAICELSKEKRQEIVSIAMKDERVKGYFTKESLSLNYILPTEWFAAEIPMNGVEYRSGHKSPQDYDKSKYKIIFTTPEVTKKGKVSGTDILQTTRKITPIVEVWVDLDNRQVIEIKEITNAVKYEGIPEAIY